MDGNTCEDQVTGSSFITRLTISETIARANRGSLIKVVRARLFDFQVVVIFELIQIFCVVSFLVLFVEWWKKSVGLEDWDSQDVRLELGGVH